MLEEVKTLHGAAVHALDGEIGSVDEIFFDDAHWTVRYLVVKTGGWLSERKVLISPLAFGVLDWRAHAVYVNLTREQIQNSPDVKTDEPVSRQWEAGYFDYYAWPYYWGGTGGWGNNGYPGSLLGQPFNPAATPLQIAEEQALDNADTHLRSTTEVTGYKISATDGHIGHVEDFIVNDSTWRIAYLAVDTRDWWPGKKVLLPPDQINAMNWPEDEVTVRVTQDEVRSAPQWNPGEPINAAFEKELAAYYAVLRPVKRELAAV